MSISEAVNEGNGLQPIPFEGGFQSCSPLGSSDGWSDQSTALKDASSLALASSLVLALSGCLHLSSFKTGRQKPSHAVLPRRSDCFQTQFLQRALKINGGAFSSCSAWVPGLSGSVVVASGLGALWRVESSWTHVLCIGRWVLNHWNTRDVSPAFF